MMDSQLISWKFRIAYFVDQARVHMIIRNIVRFPRPLNFSVQFHAGLGCLSWYLSASAVHATSQTMGARLTGIEAVKF